MEDMIFKCFLLVKRLLRAGRKPQPLANVPAGLSPAFGRLLGQLPAPAQGARYVAYMSEMAEPKDMLAALAQHRNRRQSLLARFPELRTDSLDHPQRPALRNLDRRISLIEEIMLKAGHGDRDTGHVLGRALKGVVSLRDARIDGLPHNLTDPVQQWSGQDGVNQPVVVPSIRQYQTD
jgi:hypothetical protein